MRAVIRKFLSRLKSLSIQLIIPLLISLIVVVYFANRTFVFVHPGEAAVLWSRFFGGTRTNYVYPEGIHIIFPWDTLSIYNVRIQEMATELNVLTNTGLDIHLYLSIRYQPDYKLLGVLHQQVGPDYPQKVILPEIKSVLREIIGTMGAEEVYTTGRRVIIEAINQAIEQISQRYILVDKVLIERIELPTTVATAIQYKIEQKHLVEAHEFIVQREKKEAERKRIEGEGFRDQLKTVAEAVPPGEILRWRGIEATLKLAESDNAKVVIIGSGQEPFQLFGQVPLAPEAWDLLTDTADEPGNADGVQERIDEDPLSAKTPVPDDAEMPVNDSSSGELPTDIERPGGVQE